MKHFILCTFISVLLLSNNTGYAQPQCTVLSIDHFGGNGEDGIVPNPGDITYPDGTFSLAISTTSTSGNIKVGCTGGAIFRRYDANCTTVLSKTCAPIGSNFHWPSFYVYPQSNGDTILIGQSDDNSGDYGMERRDASGNVLWTKTYGGSGYEGFSTAVTALDSGFFLCGEAHSNDGEVGLHYGGYFSGDIWIVRVNNNGDTLWTRDIGGTDQDGASCIIASGDGGCYLFGQAASNDYDVTGNHGQANGDVYVAKLDGQGNIEWHHCYGGSGADGGGYVKAIKDGSGGFYIGADAGSTDGDVQRRPAMAWDFWLLHIDSAGNLLWENTFGGPGWEFMYDICRATDGSLWMGGISGGDTAQTVGGDVAFNYGLKDGWVAHADSMGNFINSCTMGADNDEYLHMLHPLPGGTVLAGGYYFDHITPGSGSPGFPETTEGEGDIFLARLSPETEGIKDQAIPPNTWELFPNPADRKVTIRIKGNNAKYKVQVADASGKKIYRHRFRRQLTIDTGGWGSGVYFVHLTGKSGRTGIKKITIKK